MSTCASKLCITAALLVTTAVTFAAQHPATDLDSSLNDALRVHRRQNTVQSFRQLALVYNDRNETAQALSTIDEGVKRWPSDAGLLAAKGQIYWRLLRTNSAEHALLTASKSAEFAAEAQYWLGQIYYFKGWQAENAFPGWHEEVAYRPRAVAAFKAALAQKPDWDLARDALARAEGRDSALAAAAVAPDETDAKQILDALRAKEFATVAERGAAFRASHRFSSRLIDVLDAMMTAYASLPSAAIGDIVNVIEARLALRPDPMSYAAAANLLLGRNTELARAEQIADRGRAVGEQFIRENESSYKLDGKVQGSLDRNAATFADLAGWAAYLQQRRDVAERRLAEAERLFRALDVNNQLHLAQLSRDKGDLDIAREHYLNVLTLSAAPPPARETARTGIADIRKAQGENPAEFDAWLSSTLDRLREERRKALLSSMAGKPVPVLRLNDLQGHPVDLQAERGNVVLLNFFSAW